MNDDTNTELLMQPASGMTDSEKSGVTWIAGGLACSLIALIICSALELRTLNRRLAELERLEQRNEERVTAWIARSAEFGAAIAHIQSKATSTEFSQRMANAIYELQYWRMTNFPSFVSTTNQTHGREVPQKEGPQ